MSRPERTSLPPPPEVHIYRCRKRSRDDNDASEADAPAPSQGTKRRKSSLSNYPVQVQHKVHELVTDILASIYFDINYLCIQRATLHWGFDEEKIGYYRLQFREATILLDQVVGHSLNPERYEGYDPRGTLRRLSEFKETFGWKVLSIVVAAEGFRRAVREIRHGGIWRDFLEKVKENSWSLEVFVRSRNLDWRGQLAKYAGLGIAGVEEALRPVRKMWEQHPHHIVQGVDRKIRRPWFEGSAQIHIDQSVFDPRNWDAENEMDPQDPTIRGPRDGKCDICGSHEICNCELDFSAGSLVELVERPITGTGVRALANFKKGDILGQFTGELYPPDYDDDQVYSLVHVSENGGDETVAMISPQRYGNWTRYLAHSCRASTKFNARTVGSRTVMTVEAVRDINAFEDITVHYGAEYWARRECLCGEDNCLSKEKRKKQ
ncbi:SET domain protein [Aspergillus undulatus]|uniref:SET domain protein n=1 Tax=Aspergillus undulatus TaxID=1810928 RepID=UPI003CCD6655